jgi:hypothetical protein
VVEDVGAVQVVAAISHSFRMVLEDGSDLGVLQTPTSGWQPGNELYFRDVRYRIVRAVKPSDTAGEPGTFVVTPVAAGGSAG